MRRLIQKENPGERVSIVWHGSLARLPYADNLINLVVVETAPGLLSQGGRLNCFRKESTETEGITPARKWVT
jgi:hypothetical protein